MRGAKRLLITGANGALGVSVVDRFLKDGCSVLGAFYGVPESSLPERPGLSWVQMDVTDPVSVSSTVKSLASSGPIEGLIHCAGGFRFAEADKISNQDIDFLLNTNLKSAFYLVREILPWMKKQDFGRIVFMSSRSTLQPPSGMSAYAASKAGLNALSASVAEEVRKFNINVNVVMPTIIDTPANRKEMPKADFSTWVSREDLAEIIFSLTQPWGKPIHGAQISISGRV